MVHNNLERDSQCSYRPHTFLPSFLTKMSNYFRCLSLNCGFMGNSYGELHSTSEFIHLLWIIHNIDKLRVNIYVFSSVIFLQTIIHSTIIY